MVNKSEKSHFGSLVMLICIMVVTHSFAWWLGRTSGYKDIQSEIRNNALPGYEETNEYLRDAAARRSRISSPASRPDTP